MKLGAVIGRVTLNKVVSELTGARWLIVSPFTREHFQRGTETPLGKVRGQVHRVGARQWPVVVLGRHADDRRGRRVQPAAPARHPRLFPACP